MEESFEQIMISNNIHTPESGPFLKKRQKEFNRSWNILRNIYEKIQFAISEKRKVVEEAQKELDKKFKHAYVKSIPQFAYTFKNLNEAEKCLNSIWNTVNSFNPYEEKYEAEYNARKSWFDSILYNMPDDKEFIVIVDKSFVPSKENQERFKQALIEKKPIILFKKEATVKWAIFKPNDQNFLYAMDEKTSDVYYI